MFNLELVSAIMLLALEAFDAQVNIISTRDSELIEPEVFSVLSEPCGRQPKAKNCDPQLNLKCSEDTLTEYSICICKEGTEPDDSLTACDKIPKKIKYGDSCTPHEYDFQNNERCSDEYTFCDPELKICVCIEDKHQRVHYDNKTGHCYIHHVINSANLSRISKFSFYISYFATCLIHLLM